MMKIVETKDIGDPTADNIHEHIKRLKDISFSMEKEFDRFIELIKDLRSVNTRVYSTLYIMDAVITKSQQENDKQS